MNKWCVYKRKQLLNEQKYTGLQTNCLPIFQDVISGLILGRIVKCPKELHKFVDLFPFFSRISFIFCDGWLNQTIIRIIIIIIWRVVLFRGSEHYNYNFLFCFCKTFLIAFLQTFFLYVYRIWHHLAFTWKMFFITSSKPLKFWNIILPVGLRNLTT